MSDGGSGCRGSVLDIRRAADAAVKEGLQWPELSQAGIYNTLNSMGSMAPMLREVDEKFIEIAAQPESKVLEIGAAFGHICIEALKQGAADYTIVELGQKHLKIFAKEIMAKMPEKAAAITLIHGAFPNESVLEYLQPNAYDVILARRVLQFLTEKEVKIAFHKFWRLLKPGGKLILSLTTPYTTGKWMTTDAANRLETELEAFRIRLREKTMDDNQTVPGFIADPKQRLDPNDANRVLLAANHAFLFDQDVARYLLEKEHFIIEKCDYYAMDSIWKDEHGRDRLVVIAQKPQLK